MYRTSRRARPAEGVRGRNPRGPGSRSIFSRVCDTIIVTWPSERAHDRRYTILDTRERLSVTRVAHMHFVSYYRISHTVCATALAHHVCAKAASSMLSGGMRGVGAA